VFFFLVVVIQNRGAFPGLVVRAEEQRKWRSQGWTGLGLGGRRGTVEGNSKAPDGDVHRMRMAVAWGLLSCFEPLNKSLLEECKL
jgi:hypothetical protein